MVDEHNQKATVAMGLCGTMSEVGCENQTRERSETIYPKRVVIPAGPVLVRDLDTGEVYTLWMRESEYYEWSIQL